MSARTEFNDVAFRPDIDVHMICSAVVDLPVTVIVLDVIRHDIRKRVCRPTSTPKSGALVFHGGAARRTLMSEGKTAYKRTDIRSFEAGARSARTDICVDTPRDIARSSLRDDKR